MYMIKVYFNYSKVQLYVAEAIAFPLGNLYNMFSLLFYVHSE